MNFADGFNDGIILPKLIKQLNTILQQYPDDGQILKVSLCSTTVISIYRWSYKLVNMTWWLSNCWFSDRPIGSYMYLLLPVPSRSQLKDVGMVVTGKEPATSLPLLL